MQSIEDFRNALFNFSDRVNRIKEHIKNEEATKTSLILPFIALLGYDDRDPTEVSPEHSADFNDKFRRRVDYAILRDGKPSIAVECKSLGNVKKDDRGQLKAYFNAVKTVKLAILSDGIVYEFFVDSVEPNMMDDEPFLVVDFTVFNRNQSTDTIVEGLYSLTKAEFKPDTISENARRSITYREIFRYLAEQLNEPSLEFTKFLLKEVDIKHVRQNMIETYRNIVKSAFADVFTANVLKKLDINRSPVKPTVTAELPTDVNAGTDTAPSAQDKGIVTTDAELQALELICRRLAFLAAGDAVFFDAISKISFKDYQGKMVVFYQQERKGRLIDIIETKAGIRYVLSDGGDPSPVNDLTLFDDRLKALFAKRIAEMNG